MRLLLSLPLVLSAGCSLVTVQQAPFDPLRIQADQPDKPPPRVVLMPSSIRITEKIQFAFDSAEIEPVSFSLLDELVGVLVQNPQIKEVRIEGHTDSQGNPNYNRKLSKERAQSVKKYFVEKGIAAGRLQPKGYGPDKPITDGTDEASHEINRRVEFTILKQTDKKVLVESE